MLNIATRTAFKASLPRLGALPARSLNYTSRSLITLKDHKYTAHATAKGQGRNGEVKSDGFELDLATPKELGGSGKGKNPEQLFAMGYSACLLGAIQMMAGRMGKTESIKGAKVHASVHLGEPNDIGGFGIAVDIKVEGVPDDVLKAGHEACPYSRALQHGAVVNVSKA